MHKLALTKGQEIFLQSFNPELKEMKLKIYSTIFPLLYWKKSMGEIKATKGDELAINIST